MAIFNLQGTNTQSITLPTPAGAESDTVKIFADNRGDDAVYNFDNTGFDKIDLTDIPAITSTANFTIQVADPSTARLVFPQLAGTEVLISGITAAELTTLANQIFIFAAGDGQAPSTPRPVNAEVFVVSAGTTPTPAGTLIGKVTATDNVGVTSYAIQGGSAAGAFSINNAGDLTYNGGLATNSSFDLQVVARDAANNTSTPATIRVYTGIQRAIEDPIIGDGINQSSTTAGRETIRLARGSYGGVSLYEKSPSDADTNKRIRIVGPNAADPNPAVAGTAARPSAEAELSSITLVSRGAAPGIRDGYEINGILLTGGRVDLIDYEGITQSERDNLIFRNNIFRLNPSSDPTIQIETFPGGPVSDNIVIENNFFDGVGPRASGQAMPQAIKLNNVNGVTIRANIIRDYGPGAQGFGVLTQYGASGVNLTNNQFSNIGIAPFAGPGITQS